MEQFIQLFGNISLSTVILVIVAVVFIVKNTKKTYKAIIDDHDKRQEKEELLKGIKEDVNAIKTKQEDFEVALKEVKVKQEEISTKQQEIEESRREHDRNKTRARLVELYEKYATEKRNPTFQWTRMEKETFDKLFEDYEKLGGNGFIHNKVKPAMDDLYIIDENDVDAIKLLWETRKG